jgi:hypothetical protein
VRKGILIGSYGDAVELDLTLHGPAADGSDTSNSGTVAFTEDSVAF